MAWLVVTALAYSALGLLDYFRGISDFWLQVIFRELFTPGVGGYFAVFTINKFIKGANLKWSTVGFCLILTLVYIGSSVFVILVLRTKPDFSWSEQFFAWLIPAASCIGARMGLTKYAPNRDSERSSQ